MYKALWESIEHWHDNYKLACKYELISDYIYGDYCPLCQASKNASGRIQCRVCPIYRYTGYTNCEDTPWHDVETAIHGFESFEERVICAVIDEYQFLVELAFIMELDNDNG